MGKLRTRDARLAAVTYVTKLYAIVSSERPRPVSGSLAVSISPSRSSMSAQLSFLFLMTANNMRGLGKGA